MLFLKDAAFCVVKKYIIFSLLICYKHNNLSARVMSDLDYFCLLWFQSSHGANQARVLTHLLAMEAGSQAHRLGRWATFNMQCPARIVEIITFLLNENVDLNSPRSTLATAVATLPETSVQSFIDKSADVNSQYDDGESCLHTAVRVNSEKKFRLILENGANLSSEWQELTALECSILYYPNGNITRCIDKYLAKYSTDQLLTLSR